MPISANIISYIITFLLANGVVDHFSKYYQNSADSEITYPFLNFNIVAVEGWYESPTFFIYNSYIDCYVPECAKSYIC